MSKKQFIIAGIGTDVGKTIASAIIAQALEASYWKPIQAGDLESSDSIMVASLTNKKVTILPEQFCLTASMSPHASAELDNIFITEEAFEIPRVKGNLIIEGAGGIMVPLNNEGLLSIDLFKKWNLPVILISRHYLGSINHTLLSIEALKAKKIPIEGIVFIGDENKETESIILKVSALTFIARIPIASEVNALYVRAQVGMFQEYFQS